MPPISTRPIPKSGELIPIVGLGTYQAFTELRDQETRDRLGKVLSEFHRRGGKFIDSSPMYGPAEAAVGELLPRVPDALPADWFLATKVWTDGREEGIAQMRSSEEKLARMTLDLMQIHNLRDWRAHLPTLREWKERGRIRYIGVTTWGGINHEGMEALMKSEPLDFVQFTYNVTDREAERRLLPLAKDKGIATIINRPFGQGSLLSKLKGKPLPQWVGEELACQDWAQALLKFTLGDDRVTVVIPATSNPEHLITNMGAGIAPWPDAIQREKLAREVRSG